MALVRPQRVAAGGREVMLAFNSAAPNPRVQRTRSSASPRSSPLTRNPLGCAPQRVIGAVLGPLLVAMAFAGCTTVHDLEGPPKPTLKYQAADGTWRDDVEKAVVPPILLTRIEPSWPVHLRTPANTGDVVLDVLVSQEGHPLELNLKRGISKAMNEEAIGTVKKWRYKPATLGTEPVAAWIQTTVGFHLY